MTEPVLIERAGAERIADLEPLWGSLVEHHGVAGPQLGPLLERGESWRRRRAYYERELARDGAFLMLALRGPALIGYTLVTPAGPSHTWDGNDPAAEVATLALVPSERGRGTGQALIERVKQETRAAGIRHLRLEVLVTNHDAIRFYEREGFQPRFIAMGATL